ncbi:MAG: hypothetical protein KC609_26330 [Myxococcales bacterium]|nr:hypothetical protein [Myxococcales bacterium]
MVRRLLRLWLVATVALSALHCTKEGPSDEPDRQLRAPTTPRVLRLPLPMRLVPESVELLGVVDVPQALALLSGLDGVLRWLGLDVLRDRRLIGLEAMLTAFRQTIGIDLHKTKTLVSWLGVGSSEIFCFAAPLSAVDVRSFAPFGSHHGREFARRRSGVGYLVVAEGWGVVCERAFAARAVIDVYLGRARDLTASARWQSFARLYRLLPDAPVRFYLAANELLRFVASPTYEALRNVPIAATIDAGGLRLVAETDAVRAATQLAALDEGLRSVRGVLRGQRAILQTSVLLLQRVGLTASDITRFYDAFGAAIFVRRGDAIRLSLALPPAKLVVISLLAITHRIFYRSPKRTADIRQPIARGPKNGAPLVSFTLPRRPAVLPPLPMPNAQPKDTEYVLSLSTPPFLALVRELFPSLKTALRIGKLASYDEMIASFTKEVGFDPRKTSRVVLWMRFSGPDVACFAVSPRAIVSERFVKDSVHEGVSIQVRTSGGGSMALLDGYAVVCDRKHSLREAIDVFKGKRKALWHDDDGFAIAKLERALSMVDHMLFFQGSAAFKIGRTSELRDVVFAVGARRDELELLMTVPPKRLDKAMHQLNELLDVSRAAWQKLRLGLAKNPTLSLPFEVTLSDLERFGDALGETRFRLDHDVARAKLVIAVRDVARLVLAWQLLRDSPRKKSPAKLGPQPRKPGPTPKLGPQPRKPGPTPKLGPRP